MTKEKCMSCEMGEPDKVRLNSGTNLSAHTYEF